MHSTHKLITLTKEILDHQSDKDFFSNPQHYDTLIHLIMRHNHLYYIDHQPVISDNDYDTLFSLLQQFEAYHPEFITPDSPTQRLVNQYDIQSGFEKTNHAQPILSLQNTYNSEDIRDWYTSISQLLNKTNYDHLPLEFILEPKYDGLSIVLTYRKGQLVQAVTRGDGYTGDNVTANIKTIPHLPKQLPYQEEIILRGEVMMPKSVFKKLNQEREANDEPLFANTRNAAAGSLKLLDTNQVAKRGLTLYLYDVLQGPKSVLEHFQQMQFPQTTRTHSLDSLIATIDDHSFKNTLLDSDIDFDGLVIKVADNSAREIL